MYTPADLLEEINWRQIEVEPTPTGVALVGPGPSITPEILAASRYYLPYLQELLELRWQWRSNTNR